MATIAIAIASFTVSPLKLLKPISQVSPVSNTINSEPLSLPPPWPPPQCKSAASSSSTSPTIGTKLTFLIAGSVDEKKGGGFSGMVGANDLLIVGPGVLGRLVAQKWREEHPGCEIYGQTVTVDHHEELIKVGINPCLKGSETKHKFPNVIFCAPPSRTSDYPGDVRVAALNWNGEGSFLFTSSSAPYDCFDNSPRDEDSPVVPI